MLTDRILRRTIGDSGLVTWRADLAGACRWLASRAIGPCCPPADGHRLLELAAVATAGAIAVPQNAHRAGCPGLIPRDRIADRGGGGLRLRLFVGTFLSFVE